MERGGVNLYGMVANRPVKSVDYLGLKLAIHPSNDENSAKNKMDLQVMIQTICPEASLDENGVITVGDATLSRNPKGCCCIKQLADSKNTWMIIGKVMNQRTRNTPPVDVPVTWDDRTGNPSLVYPPEGQQGPPAPGSGTGGGVIVPLPGGNIDWGYIDVDGKPRIAPLWRILAHELCGHAAFMDAGLEDNGHGGRAVIPNPKPGRPEHDQAINAENEIANEHKGESKRGKYNDPKHPIVDDHENNGGGESFPWPANQPLPN